MLRLQFLMIAIVVSVLCSQLEGDCYWDYKCCSFKEVDGETVCVRMCAPKWKCNGSPELADKNEEFGDHIDENAPSNLRLKAYPCRRGFQHLNGRCRKVYGRTQNRLADPSV